MSLVGLYSNDIYHVFRKCKVCGEMRAKNCFPDTCLKKKRGCPTKKCSDDNYYPPEFAYIGDDYGGTELRIMFAGMIPYINRENYKRGAWAVPIHTSYPEFRSKYNPQFFRNTIVTEDYGLNYILEALSAKTGVGISLQQICFTNIAKCPSWRKVFNSEGFDQEEDALLRNCIQTVFLKELQILKPQCNIFTL